MLNNYIIEEQKMGVIMLGKLSGILYINSITNIYVGTGRH